MEREPTDEELHAFVSALLSNLDKALRESDVIQEAIRAHRAMWVALYHATLEFDEPADSE